MWWRLPIFSNGQTSFTDFFSEFLSLKNMYFFVCHINYCIFAYEKSCLTSKRMQIAEIRTVAKSLPPFRWDTHKSLILSYSEYFGRILAKNPHWGIKFIKFLPLWGIFLYLTALCEIFIVLLHPCLEKQQIKQKSKRYGRKE